jgi:sugar phosphate isomerase/epimerase
MEPLVPPPASRRGFLGTAVAALAATRLSAAADAPATPAPSRGKPTVFQHACMTLVYSAFPLERALTGIASAGYRFVAWGTRHKEAAGDPVPMMPEDAPAERAKALGARCRDLGLEPVMMFSAIYPEKPKAVEVLTQRIKQASAAGIGQVLTFGHTEGGDRKLWIERFKQLGPVARDHGVTIVVKQHGGSTGTGEALSAIVKEVADPNVWVNYDAGNVMDYLNLDPIPDVVKTAPEIRSFCIKDHRNWPQDQDCGPGFGAIDHYRLFEPVAFTGLTMPLAYENIFPASLPRPAAAEGVDTLARRAREYCEAVIAGLQSALAPKP